MITKIIENSNLDWIKSDILPKRNKDKSEEIIMLFNDGFVSRGYYDYLENCWIGHNSIGNLEKYYCSPDYYIYL